MTLTALLSAQARPETDSGEASLVALLPVAGMTLIERQAEQAAASGIRDILVLVDTIPASLSAALDRVRATGIALTTVREGVDVLAAAATATRLVLVADGLLAPGPVWATLVAAPAPTILAVADTPATAGFERIDAQSRWAGLAIVPARMIAALDALPEDWDPQLALLRTAIQEGAPAISCEAQAFERGDLSIVTGQTAAELVELRMLATSAQSSCGLLHAGALMPLARTAVRPLLREPKSGIIAHVLAGLSGAGSLVAMMFAQPWLAVALAVIVAIAAAAATAIAAFRQEPAWARILGESGGYLSLLAFVAGGWAVAPAGTAPMLLSAAVAAVAGEQLGLVLAQREQAARRLIADPLTLWAVLAVGLVLGAAPLAIAFTAPLSIGLLGLAVWTAGKAKTV
jgi:hypothetical protein